MVQFYRYTHRNSFPDLIQGVWSLISDADATEFELVTDGYPEIIFVVKGKITFTIDSEVFVVSNHAIVGNVDKYVKVNFAPNSVFISVKLMPWALPSIINKSAFTITNKIVPLSTYLKEQLKFSSEEVNSKQLSPYIQKQIFPYLENILQQTNETTPLLSSDILKLFKDVQNLSLEYKKVPFGSKRYFEKLYKEYVGLSPMKYRRLLKIKKASLLLANKPPHQSITSIALALGYFDQSHFYKDFLRFTKTTPSEFISNTKKSPVLVNLNYIQQYEYS